MENTNGGGVRIRTVGPKKIINKGGRRGGRLKQEIKNKMSIVITERQQKERTNEGSSQ